ncbi:MAG: tripartite tricarboxylate transporter substrate binding protein [Betaproteobacteria bacterium]|nr:tripartite tricarboxylate transporter substrate binding protein [Betaproteobacteria bacterium]MDH5344083.1 tripartite tricarboxylate transporter substrate binding protein [Betaproteobacteria bacterium]
MNKINRLFISLALTALVVPALPAVAQSTYPTRTVRLIVPSSPGGGTDISARILAPQLTQFLGQQVIVENRPGAGTMIGGEAVARAAPDGYTLLMGISTLAINPAMYKKVPYDALKDLAPISQAVALSNVLVIHPSLPSRNLKAFIAFATARPGELNFASAGKGTSPHLSMELFLVMAKLKMLHVPYKGSGPGVTDLIAGHVPVMMPNMLSAQPHIKSGRLRALGVTGSKRAPGADDIPTIAEAGVPGYEAVQWYGVLAPAGTPGDIISKLHAGVVRAVQNPEVRKRLMNDGAEPVGSSPAEFAAYIKAETDKWAKVIKAAGIDPN